MSDNNQIFYENKPLYERFPEKGKNVVENQYNKICFVKTMIRGHLKNISIVQNHILNGKLKACNGFGKISILRNKIESVNPDYKFNFIRHYYGKSVQEFVEKMNRGDLLRGNDKIIIDWAIEKYFYINKITLQKIEYLKRNLGPEYNFSNYIDQIQKKL